MIDMISENYTKAEIQSWSEEVEGKAPKEKEIEEIESAEAGVGEPEEGLGEPSEEGAKKREEISTQTIIGIIIALAVVGNNRYCSVPDSLKGAISAGRWLSLLLFC
ncbi:hypothetical protein AKJ57_02590 [candidate division MSBL1 archaeon SCGC-AAA259A05]|uniref:Uncharacterized protein n=1 Tax=candidate division MSBL1 archaeon SCGC-AAA259A05 TaxID=1698259 RepID=A0A133UA64_9EURY|nr:hypothetical protein AKJ57_02590 [candidate division MSBL1 archaeon SCGC-AAA259A05]